MYLHSPGVSRSALWWVQAFSPTSLAYTFPQHRGLPPILFSYPTYKHIISLKSNYLVPYIWSWNDLLCRSTVIGRSQIILVNRHKNHDIAGTEGYGPHGRNMGFLTGHSIFLSHSPAPFLSGNLESRKWSSGLRGAKENQTQQQWRRLSRLESATLSQSLHVLISSNSSCRDGWEQKAISSMSLLWAIGFVVICSPLLRFVVVSEASSLFSTGSDITMCNGWLGISWQVSEAPFELIKYIRRLSCYSRQAYCWRCGHSTGHGIRWASQTAPRVRSALLVHGHVDLLVLCNVQGHHY